ncbi:MAG: DNA polymerase III subunit beta, partial [Verrucomicrobia bacterium]|nr:DNA polymerase III subunit beta [Verrucomicrobiota bacterium]
MNVEIEIPVAQLKSVLPGLGKIVPRTSSLPVLQCVKASLSQDQKTIELQAHDLDQVATVRLENQANGLPGELLVPLDMLTKIVKGCAPGQSVRLISTKEETKIRYTVAGSPVDRLVSHIPPAEWPTITQITGEMVLLDETFKVALKEAMECASEDSSRYVLNGACLDTREKGAHYVIGTDGRHLYSANTFQFNLPESLIVPTCKFLSWAWFEEDGPWKLRMVPAMR